MTWGRVTIPGPPVVLPAEGDSRLGRVVSEIVAATTQNRIPTTWRDEFRTSAQPHCSLLRILGGMPDGEDAFQSDFYFKSGDAIHEVFQTHMPLANLAGARVWGHWICSCGLTTEVPDFQPLACAGCGLEGKRLRYGEVTVRWNRQGWNGEGDDPAGMSGHIDMIIWHPEMGWLLIDFKSAGLHYFTEARYASYLPFKKNVVQVESYCLMLKRCWGVDVTGYALVYFCRDQRGKLTGKGDDATVQVDWKMAVRAREWSEEVAAERTLWLNRITEARAVELDFRAAVGAADLEGAYREASRLVAARPCQKRGDYDRYMSIGWLRGGCEWRRGVRCTVSESDLVAAAIAPEG